MSLIVTFIAAKDICSSEQIAGYTYLNKKVTRPHTCARGFLIVGPNVESNMFTFSVTCHVHKQMQEEFYIIF